MPSNKQVGLALLPFLYLIAVAASWRLSTVGGLPEDAPDARHRPESACARVLADWETHDYQALAAGEFPTAIFWRAEAEKDMDVYARWDCPTKAWLSAVVEAQESARSARAEAGLATP